MSRDHKNTPRVKPAGGAAAGSGGSSQSGGGLFTGIVIGLILGVVISVGVVYFVNNKVAGAPTPGLKPAEPVASSLPKPDANGVTSGEEAPASEASAKSKYDFFDILPGTEPPAKTGTEAPTAEPTTTAAATTPPSVDKPATNKTDLRQDSAATAANNTSTSTDKKPEEKKPATRALLQLGSFQNESDADNLKAKLAIIGVEASVRSKDIPGKGLWHRVIAGPYNSAEDVEKAKALLQQNGINPSVISLK